MNRLTIEECESYIKNLDPFEDMLEINALKQLAATMRENERLRDAFRPLTYGRLPDGSGIDVSVSLYAERILSGEPYKESESAQRL